MPIVLEYQETILSFFCIRKGKNKRTVAYNFVRIRTNDNDLENQDLAVNKMNSSSRRETRRELCLI